jgi:hypothetical protein
MTDSIINMDEWMDGWKERWNYNDKYKNIK